YDVGWQDALAAPGGRAAGAAGVRGALGGPDYDVAGLDAGDGRFEMRLDFAREDAVLEVGQHPVFDPREERGAAIDQRDASSPAEKIQGHFGGGVLAADHHDVAAPSRVRFAVVVRDVRKVFSGDAEG